MNQRENYQAFCRGPAAALHHALGDRALGIVGNERRPIGQVAQADTLTHYNPAHPYIIAEYDLADAG